MHKSLGINDKITTRDSNNVSHKTGAAVQKPKVIYPPPMIGSVFQSLDSWLCMHRSAHN